MKNARIPSTAALEVMFALTMLFALAILVIPSMRSSTDGQRSEPSNVVPEIGTTEYVEWNEQFKERYGRDFDVNDYLTAAENGVHVFAGYTCACFGFFLLCYGIWDIGTWFRERKAYKRHETDVQPRPTDVQVAVTLIYVIASALLCGLYFVMPHLATPVK